MLPARRRPHSKLTHRTPHRRAKDWTTSQHMPCDVGRHAARSPTRHATALAKPPTPNSALDTSSRWSSEAGTCTSVPGCRACSTVIGCVEAGRVRTPCELTCVCKAGLSGRRLSSQDCDRGASWISRDAYWRRPSWEHRVGAQSHRDRKSLRGSSGRHSRHLPRGLSGCMHRARCRWGKSLPGMRSWGRAGRPRG